MADKISFSLIYLHSPNWQRFKSSYTAPVAHTADEFRHFFDAKVRTFVDITMFRWMWINE